MNKILNTHRPLLRSFITELSEKIFTQKQHDGNEGYLLNQMPELWDIDSMKDSIEYKENLLKERNHPLTIKEYQSLVLSHLNEDKFKEQDRTLSFIYQDAQKINTLLKKLDEMGVNYSWSIVGGAVRDFVLDKPIKDIDIMLSIPDIRKNWRVLNKLADISFLMKYFNKELVFKLIETNFFANLSEPLEIEELDNNNTEKDKEKLLSIARERKQKLLMLCFDGQMNEQFLSTMDDLSQSNNYAAWLKRKNLFGVLKLNQEKIALNYPVDILLTSSPTSDFIRGFDFDLCKAAFTFKNNEYEVEFPLEPLELISRFSAVVSFWADVHNKKMTLEVDGMTEKMIEDAILIHYKRLLSKYSDFNLNIIATEESEDSKKMYSCAQKLYLNEILENKEDENKRKI